jgi:hypothetical protein
MLRERKYPEIPVTIQADVSNKIKSCWKSPDERPTFCELLAWLEQIEFRIVPGVNVNEVKMYLAKVTKASTRSDATQWKHVDAGGFSEQGRVSPVEKE